MQLSAPRATLRLHFPIADLRPERDPWAGQAVRAELLRLELSEPQFRSELSSGPGPPGPTRLELTCSDLHGESPWESVWGRGSGPGREKLRAKEAGSWEQTWAPASPALGTGIACRACSGQQTEWTRFPCPAADHGHETGTSDATWHWGRNGERQSDPLSFPFPLRHLRRWREATCPLPASLQGPRSQGLWSHVLSAPVSGALQLRVAGGHLESGARGALQTSDRPVPARVVLTLNPQVNSAQWEVAPEKEELELSVESPCELQDPEPSPFSSKRTMYETEEVRPGTLRLVEATWWLWAGGKDCFGAPGDVTQHRRELRLCHHLVSMGSREHTSSGGLEVRAKSGDQDPVPYGPCTLGLGSSPRKVMRGTSGFESRLCCSVALSSQLIA